MAQMFIQTFTARGVFGVLRTGAKEVCLLKSTGKGVMGCLTAVCHMIFQESINWFYSDMEDGVLFSFKLALTLASGLLTVSPMNTVIGIDCYWRILSTHKNEKKSLCFS